MSTLSQCQRRHDLAEDPQYWETDNQEPHPKDLEWAERKSREVMKEQDIEYAVDNMWDPSEERRLLALQLWIRGRLS